MSFFLYDANVSLKTIYSLEGYRNAKHLRNLLWNHKLKTTRQIKHWSVFFCWYIPALVFINEFAASWRTLTYSTLPSPLISTIDAARDASHSRLSLHNEVFLYTHTHTLIITYATAVMRAIHPKPSKNNNQILLSLNYYLDLGWAWLLPVIGVCRV